MAEPGESGLPTTLAWKLPAGLTAGPIQWPPPQVLPVGPPRQLRFEGEVLLLTDIAPTSAVSSAGPATLQARADWLVCREIMHSRRRRSRGHATDSAANRLPTRIGARQSPARVRRCRARLAGWTVAATGKGPQVEVALTPDADRGDPGQIRFFPFAEGKIEPSAPQTLIRDGATLRLLPAVASQRAGEFTRVAGVLTASKGFGALAAASIDVPLAGSIAPVRLCQCRRRHRPRSTRAATARSRSASRSASRSSARLFAQPDALRVPGALAQGAQVCGAGLRPPARCASMVWRFASGVIVSFWLLAGLLRPRLRAAGGELGWGFQLQSPAVVVSLAVLFFSCWRSIFPRRVRDRPVPAVLARHWNARNTYVNDALFRRAGGVVASPCSAAVHGRGDRLRARPERLVTLAVFTALGFGMALRTCCSLFPGMAKGSSRRR